MLKEVRSKQFGNFLPLKCVYVSIYFWVKKWWTSLMVQGLKIHFPMASHVNSQLSMTYQNIHSLLKYYDIMASWIFSCFWEHFISDSFANSFLSSEPLNVSFPQGLLLGILHSSPPPPLFLLFLLCLSVFIYVCVCVCARAHMCVCVFLS